MNLILQERKAKGCLHKNVINWGRHFFGFFNWIFCKSWKIEFLNGVKKCIHAQYLHEIRRCIFVGFLSYLLLKLSCATLCHILLFYRKEEIRHFLASNGRTNENISLQNLGRKSPSPLTRALLSRKYWGKKISNAVLVFLGKVL